MHSNSCSRLLVSSSHWLLVYRYFSCVGLFLNNSILAEQELDQQLDVLEVVDEEMGEDLYYASCWNFFGIQVNKNYQFFKKRVFSAKGL